MNLQNVAPSRPSTNGFNRRKGEKELGIKFDNKSQTGKSNFNKFTTAGLPSGNKGGIESQSRERLVYLTTCLIGHQVEVQVKDGSVYTGIFHATNAENDFGIILKMASVTSTGSSVNKAPSKTLIIPSKDLVQVVAKDVSITRDGLTNDVEVDKQQDIMTDSYISRSRNVDLERELEPWVPDDDDIECPELDSTFDRHWNRGWDQFETNAALFGVKSTFNEELYTTKLDRGPKMRELEKQALRLAREIEGEDTQDLHLAEERGRSLHSCFDLDDETKYSSVFRGVDDSGFDENDDIWDSENNKTFGNISDSIINTSLTDFTQQPPSSFPSLVEGQASQTSTSSDFYPSNSLDIEKQMFLDQNQASKSEDLVSKKESSEKGLSADATAYAPTSNNNNNKTEETCSEEKSATVKTTTQPPVVGPESSTSESGNAATSAAAAASGPALSPTSSMASLSSEKSTLNPHAKEFRLNPNAKSFVPVPMRPQSPVAEPSFYYPPPVPHMQPMPMGASFGPQQPVMYGPQGTSFQPQQPYFHQNMPQYGQQIPFGQPRAMVFMPAYPPEMPYKGRDY